MNPLAYKLLTETTESDLMEDMSLPPTEVRNKRGHVRELEDIIQATGAGGVAYNGHNLRWQVGFSSSTGRYSAYLPPSPEEVRAALEASDAFTSKFSIVSVGPHPRRCYGSYLIVERV